MTKATLYLGNKNYSSWSLRGWLAAMMSGIDFDEVVIPLGEPETSETIRKYSPSGRVPVLHHDGLVVWDSLAIGEYLAGAVGRQLWPDEPQARAVARAVAAEMHSGFAALRGELPMNVRRRYTEHQISAEAQADINRVTSIWRDCRTRFGEDGPFLFGQLSLADAMFAPVVSRFRTYAVDLEGSAAEYAAAILDLPEMKSWSQDARNEPMVQSRYEFD
ncbi:MAG TPA: glutathione S-transferase family protein [Alphaproteobacteria bacterium]|nr:glutathione S-transferase family protein [Alphaproteobacteria bacterium]